MSDDYRQPVSGDNPIIMFVGKGGVGKTTCAAATALHYASCGEIREDRERLVFQYGDFGLKQLFEIMR